MFQFLFEHELHCHHNQGHMVVPSEPATEMIYEVYGNYVEGLETDAGKISDYFGKDFICLNQKTTSPFAMNHGESNSESGKVAKSNLLE